MADDDDYYVADTPDPDVETIEALQFGGAAEGVQKLRGLIGRTMGQVEQQRALDADARRSAERLVEFQNRNPDLIKDVRASAAIERDLYDLQLEDLRAAGMNLDGWREQAGRDPTPAEIARAHQHFRAAGAKGVRSVDKLLEHAEERFNEWHGRPSRNADVNRSRAVSNRVSTNRQLRGLPQRETDTRPPIERDQTADVRTPADETRRWMGGDDEPGRAAMKHSAVEQMKMHRRGLRGPGAEHLADGGRLGGTRTGAHTGRIETRPNNDGHKL